MAVCAHQAAFVRAQFLCARESFICAGLSTGHKYRNVRAQTESASGLKPENNPLMIPNRANEKKRHAQGFPVFDTAGTAAYSKHGEAMYYSI
jgi:predicted N-acyltransferase